MGETDEDRQRAEVFDALGHPTRIKHPLTSVLLSTLTLNVQKLR